MSPETELAKRLERDHLELVASFSRTLPRSRLTRRIRIFAARKTLVLLASGFTGMLGSVLATYEISTQAFGGDVPAPAWLGLLAITAPLGVLAAFTLLVAKEDGSV